MLQILFMNRLVKTLRYSYIKSADQSIISQPAPIYNANISLISNLGQVKQLNQLLNLQNYFSEKLTSRHYTFIARKICQTIKFHQGDIKTRKNQMLSSEKIPLFLKLIHKITQVDVKGLSNDELMNLVFFSQKIIKFKPILKQVGISQQLIQKDFRQKLFNEINEEKRIQKYKLVTIQSILISVGQFLKNEQVMTLLKHVDLCLISGQYCSCLHLTLLSKFIQQFNRKNKEYEEISTKILKSCFLQVTNQLKETKEFLTARPLIQIFNIFYLLHKAEMILLLDVILSKLKEDSYDSSLYAIFFEKQLNIFLTLVEKIEPSSQSIKQLIFRLEENRSKFRFKNGKAGMTETYNDKTKNSSRVEVNTPKVGLFSKLGKKKIPDGQ